MWVLARYTQGEGEKEWESIEKRRKKERATVTCIDLDDSIGERRGREAGEKRHQQQHQNTPKHTSDVNLQADCMVLAIISLNKDINTDNE
jgi:hypothetical protein